MCTADPAVVTTIEYCSTDLAGGSESSLVNPLIVNSILCVAVDNNEIVGEFYASVPEEKMTSSAAFLRNTKDSSFTNTAKTDTAADLVAGATTSSASKTAYEPGDMLRIFAVSSNESIRGPVLAGFGPAIASSECWDDNAVRFEFNQKQSRCTRVVHDLERDCLSHDLPFVPAAFVTNLLVAKWPNISSTDDSSALLQVNVLVQELDRHTKQLELLDLTALPSYYPHPTFETNLTTNTSVCAGIMHHLDYTIAHDGEGHLTQVNATIVIGSVEESAHPSVSPIQVVQTFSVRFETSAPIDPDKVTLANGNINSYPRSGNPGYLTHYPVRVGVVETNENSSSTASTEIVSEMTSGLRLPGLGDCNIDMSLDSTALPIPVNFGEDSQTACSMTMTAAEFQALCSQDNPVIDALRVNFTRVARFGNSDPYLISEWLELDYDAPVKNSGVFVDSAATAAGTVELQCQGLITALHLEFLVANVGSVANPQHKIVAARAFHSTDTWRFWKSGTSGGDRSQTFLMYTTVTFVWVESSQVDTLIPPAPPVWFSIPSDVFYPFTLNAATALEWRPAWLLASVLVCAACLAPSF